MSYRNTTLLLVASSLGLSSTALSQEDDQSQTVASIAESSQRASAAKAELQSRVERIEFELEALDRDALPEDHWAREWAGDYYVGDGLGMNVRISIAPESGFAYTWSGCMGLYYYSYGTIKEVLPDGLLLDTEVNLDSTHPFMDSRLYFVKWGADRFLIPECKMQDFVNDFNRGGYARSSPSSAPRLNGTVGRFMASTHRKELPELPVKWQDKLLLEQITLEVVRATALPKEHVTGDVWRFSFDVEFAGGSDVGVHPGMEFTLDGGYVTIAEVNETSARGLHWFYESETAEPDPAPAGRIITLPETDQ